jgi:hypothetical protein
MQRAVLDPRRKTGAVSERRALCEPRVRLVDRSFDLERGGMPLGRSVELDGGELWSTTKRDFPTTALRDSRGFERAAHHVVLRQGIDRPPVRLVCTGLYH